MSYVYIKIYKCAIMCTNIRVTKKNKKTYMQTYLLFQSTLHLPPGPTYSSLPPYQNDLIPGTSVVFVVNVVLLVISSILCSHSTYSCRKIYLSETIIKHRKYHGKRQHPHVCCSSLLHQNKQQWLAKLFDSNVVQVAILAASPTHRR